MFDSRPQSTTEWLLAIAAGGILLSSPYGAKFVVKELRKYLSGKITAREIKKELDNRNLSRVLYGAKQRKLIKIEREGDRIRIFLTEKGLRRKLSYNLNRLQIKKPEKWDGKWRLVMFDIPEDKKAARDALRAKLKDLKFIQFQKSVWLYPHPCALEIDALAETFNVADCITYLTVTIEEDEPLRAKFQL